MQPLSHSLPPRRSARQHCMLIDVKIVDFCVLPKPDILESPPARWNALSLGVSREPMSWETLTPLGPLTVFTKSPRTISRCCGSTATMPATRVRSTAPCAVYRKPLVGRRVMHCKSTLRLDWTSGCRRDFLREHLSKCGKTVFEKALKMRWIHT